MSRLVDLPVRVVGDTSADVDPVVVAMGLKERDRNRAFELRETMSPEAWRWRLAPSTTNGRRLAK